MTRTLLRFLPRVRRCAGRGVPPAALLVLTALTAGACASAAVDPRVIQDAQTLARVRTAVVNDPVLGTRPIEIRVAAGSVRLTGHVYSEEEARRLMSLVQGIAGVLAVESDVAVIQAPAPGVPPPFPASGDDDAASAASARRLFAVGLSLNRTEPRAASLGERLTIGPLFRLGAGRGLGLAVAFNWLSAELTAEDGTERTLGDVRIRPVMGGVGYTWGGNRTSATVSLVAGYAFNSLNIAEAVPGRSLAVRVDDSLAWRPGLSVWYDVNGRVAVNGFAGYLVTRPTVTIVHDDRLERRTLFADTSVVRLGVAYKLF